MIAGKVSRFRQRPDGVEADGLGRARWLVGADGLHSPIRASLGLTTTSDRLRRHGLRRHFAVAPWSSQVVGGLVAGRGGLCDAGRARADRGVAVLSSRRVLFEEHLAAFPALYERLGPPCSPVRGRTAAADGEDPGGRAGAARR